jgi:hypothetical protein
MKRLGYSSPERYLAERLREELVSVHVQRTVLNDDKYI